jgi:RNA polymerase sigma-70 factor (ECF subfamily)
MPADADDDLLRRFVGGDQEAFEALFRQYQDEVFRWVVRIVRDRGLAEDATVDAFWRAYRARARFDPARSFGAWMRRIATNTALTHLEARKRRDRDVALDGREPAPARTPERQGEIASAFAALPPRLRVAAVLALVEELPYADIADALGVPTGTVKSRVFRAIRLLRQELARRGIRG